MQRRYGFNNLEKFLVDEVSDKADQKFKTF